MVGRWCFCDGRRNLGVALQGNAGLPPACAGEVPLANIVSRRKMGWVEASIGGAIMSVGIAGMHYVGMAAMRLPAVTQYSPLLVTSSIFLAIAFSLIALLMAFDLREETRWTVPRRLGSAIVMGAAVSGMHYTGMAAASFIPSSPPDLFHAVNISGVGNNAIAVVTLIVLVGAMVTSSVDKRTNAEGDRINQDLGRRVFERTSQLDTTNQELRKEIVERTRAEEAPRRAAEFDEAALKSLGEGIYTTDTNGLVTSMNSAADELFGWSFGEMRGKKMHDLTQHHSSQDHLPSTNRLRKLSRGPRHRVDLPPHRELLAGGAKNHRRLPPEPLFGFTFGGCLEGQPNFLFGCG